MLTKMRNWSRLRRIKRSPYTWDLTILVHYVSKIPVMLMPEIRNAVGVGVNRNYRILIKTPKTTLFRIGAMALLWGDRILFLGSAHRLRVLLNSCLLVCGIGRR